MGHNRKNSYRDHYSVLGNNHPTKTKHSSRPIYLTNLYQRAFNWFFNNLITSREKLQSGYRKTKTHEASSHHHVWHPIHHYQILKVQEKNNRLLVKTDSELRDVRVSSQHISIDTILGNFSYSCDNIHDRSNIREGGVLWLIVWEVLSQSFWGMDTVWVVA